MINPVPSYTLDGRLREGNTYLERSALVVSLDSGLTQGTSCLEPREQSVLSLSLVAQTVEGITEKVSDWKPVINPVQDITPDGRPMDGTAYPEHSALEVSLDSGLRAGMSSLEPLQQSVLNTSLVAQPEAEIMTSDWKPVINQVQDITPDGRPMEGTAYPEHSALGVSLDSGLMVAPPDGGSRKEFANSDVVAHPVLDINLDGRPMEGNTYMEPSALGVSLDSGLMEGMSHLEPLEQVLSVVRPDETDTPECPALASKMNHKRSRFKSSARPMLDPDKINSTDVNADVNTDLPENSAPMMNLDLRFWQSDAQLCPPVANTLERCSMEGISGRLLVNSPGLALAPDSGYVKDPPHPSPFEQGALGVNRKYDYLNSCDEPQSGSDSGQSNLGMGGRHSTCGTEESVDGSGARP